MAHHHANQTIKMLQQCQVSAPPGSVPSTSLPLTFFDIPWIICHPIKRIFFYDFPYPTHHFLQTLLPTLKHSLSLTLQHFFPYLGNLVLPPNINHPHILYHESDSIPLFVAESTADFNRLVSNSPKDVTDLHAFVPALPAPRTSENGTRFVPLLAIQVTVVPNSGFCICATYNHVAGDGAAFHQFMKFWASVCKVGSLEPSLPLPCHNREIIDDPKGIKLTHLEYLRNLTPRPEESASVIDVVRATFVLSRDQIEKLKKWVMTRTNDFGALHISSFVVTCSLVWVCLVKSTESITQGKINNLDEPYNFNFLADCRNHPQLSIPRTYFGNCLVNRFLALKRGQLLGENGLIEAVKSIESKVRDIKSDPLREAETVLSGFVRLAKSGEPMLTIAGSPKMGSYECDFGWGKPRKCEVAHIESSGSVSLSDSGEEGGIEIGVALTKTQMNCFAAILKEQLGNIVARD